MAWEVAAVGSKIGAGAISGKAVLLGGAGLAALYALLTRGGNNNVEPAAAQTEYPIPDEYAGIGSGGGGGGISGDELLAYLDDAGSQQIGELSGLAESQAILSAEIGTRLADMMNKQNENFVSMQAGAEERLLGYLDSYRQSQPAPAPAPQPAPVTNSIDAVINTWAANEQAAISRGYSGSSLNPAGLSEAGLKITYYPTGHVAFTPSGQSAPAAPTSAAPGPSGDAYRAASDDGAAAARSAVSAVTGKSGSIQSQLAGMSQSQAIDTLRAAGLAR